jgi:hypothetical protein
MVQLRNTRFGLLVIMLCAGALMNPPPRTRALAAPPAPVQLAYRTDRSDPTLPWYQLKPGEFPPPRSDHAVAGALVEADFIHRAGQFRDTATGELTDFKLLPFAVLRYQGADADLRDIPLGTSLTFSLFQDEHGAFTKVARAEDAFSLAAKTDQPLAPLTIQQRKRHTAFLKERGLPALVEWVRGKDMAVTLLGDAEDLRSLLNSQGIDLAKMALQQGRLRAVVANQDLRTYNPPVDGEGSTVLECQRILPNRFGCSGARLVIEPNLLLEGFRKGHIIRLFAPGWPVHDMPYGETLYSEAPNALVEEESPNQYPFRTDFGNADLPWYHLTAGVFPPYGSQHMTSGELVTMDAPHRRGQFKSDQSSKLVDFTLPPFGGALYHNADANLDDLPLGMHYRFYLYPDEHNAFTRAALIEDDFTRAVQERVTYRVESIDPKARTLNLARQLAPMKDEHDHLVQPPDLSHGVFGLTDRTLVWKGAGGGKVADLAKGDLAGAGLTGTDLAKGDTAGVGLAAGDLLLIELNGRTSHHRGDCIQIWDGPAAWKQATDQTQAHRARRLKAQGIPAWVDKVDGREMTITFFTASRADLAHVLGGDPWGKSVWAVGVNDQLAPGGAGAVKLGFKNHLPEGTTVSTYGCGGVRWVLESAGAPAPFAQGQIIRVRKDGWEPDVPPLQPKR